MNTVKRYTITAALPYANGPVHIGHLAGCYLPADIYVRYLRSRGRDVVFICGSDEHGVPITIRARKEGITPQQVVDKYHKMMKDTFEKFGVAFSIYSRTSSPIHHETAAGFFKKLYDKGDFDESVTEQYYDEKAGQFLADRYITGTCPNCQNPNAYGDQCERCGTSLSPTDLINPVSALSGEKPVLKKTKNWFLPLDKLQPKIEAYINSHSDWKPNVFGQCKSWLNQGLQPRAMTRDLDWGVKVPLKDAENKVLYVWFDAPIGYISATKELTKDWEKYWKDKETRLIHFIGKDNIVFHCIIFPAMLMCDGEYILPDNVPANEFLNLEGQKISTSRNWAVWLHEYLEDFPNKQDVMRYTLCANAPETKDNDFTWKDFQAKNNSELVAILGNFVHRTHVLTWKYFEGKVPAATEYTKADLTVMEEIKAFPKKIADAIEVFHFREAQAELMNLARIGNKYLADNEPWKAITHNPKRVQTVLNVSLQICANLSILMRPFMPFTADKLCALLNLSHLNWDAAGNAHLLQDNHQLAESFMLFDRIEDEQIEKQIEKLHKSITVNLQPAKNVLPQKATISYEDFEKMDMRVGTIKQAEKVAGADKLLKLTVDTGVDVKTVVSGIAKFYEPDKIVGLQVCLLVNLAPRKLRGIESQGMILMAEDPDGNLVFVSPTKTDTINGSIVK
jgi:methionyl-tRNA synthetase